MWCIINILTLSIINILIDTCSYIIIIGEIRITSKIVLYNIITINLFLYVVTQWAVDTSVNLIWMTRNTICPPLKQSQKWIKMNILLQLSSNINPQTLISPHTWNYSVFRVPIVLVVNAFHGQTLHLIWRFRHRLHRLSCFWGYVKHNKIQAVCIYNTWNNTVTRILKTPTQWWDLLSTFFQFFRVLK